MKIESTAILYLSVMFFLAILLCKTFELVIEQARKFFANGSDYIDPVKTELNTLNSKTDALRIKFESKLDVLKNEINALKTELMRSKAKPNL
jgi:predicted PurR-regulated permease PerM